MRRSGLELAMRPDKVPVRYPFCFRTQVPYASSHWSDTILMIASGPDIMFVPK